MKLTKTDEIQLKVRELLWDMTGKLSDIPDNSKNNPKVVLVIDETANSLVKVVGQRAKAPASYFITAWDMQGCAV